jgi:hypothetical protein
MNFVVWRCLLRLVSYVVRPEIFAVIEGIAPSGDPVDRQIVVQTHCASLLSSITSKVDTEWKNAQSYYSPERKHMIWSLTGLKALVCHYPFCRRCWCRTLSGPCGGLLRALCLCFSVFLFFSIIHYVHRGCRELLVIWMIMSYLQRTSVLVIFL